MKNSVTYLRSIVRTHLACDQLCLGSLNLVCLIGMEAARGFDLVRIRVAKGKLYEAKVGVFVVQKKWHKPGLGMFVHSAGIIN